MWRRTSGAELRERCDKALKIRNASQGRFERLQARVFGAFPIGREFLYLDKKLRVVGHQEYERGGAIGHMLIPHTQSAVICEYVDEKGVIRRHYIPLSSAFALAGLQPEPEGTSRAAEFRIGDSSGCYVPASNAMPPPPPR